MAVGMLYILLQKYQATCASQQKWMGASTWRGAVGKSPTGSILWLGEMGRAAMCCGWSSLFEISNLREVASASSVTPAYTHLQASLGV